MKLRPLGAAVLFTAAGVSYTWSPFQHDFDVQDTSFLTISITCVFVLHGHCRRCHCQLAD